MPEMVDGFISLLGGMHSGIAPELVKETFYAKGLNISSREGLIHTRPRFVLETTLDSGAFMGAEIWSLKSGDRLVYVLGGTLYSTPIDTWAVTNHGSYFNSSGWCYYCQADKYMIIQDGTNSAQVLDEVDGTPVIKTGHTIPIGTLMAYAHGRLHLVPKYVPGTTEPGDRYFISGDILLPNDPANVLQFTETTYWSEGGAHGIPVELGDVHGLQSFRNAATGTGAGGLVVLGKHGSSAFDVSLARSSWNSVNLSQVLFYNIGTGTVSPFSFKCINDDLAYRSLDGIRFIRYTTSAVAGSGGALSCVPSSNEVKTFIESESSNHLPYISTALCDNRMFVTAGGKAVTYNDVFTSMIVMDMASIYGLSGAPAPAYDGIWTGVNPRQVLTAVRSNAQLLLVISEGNKVYSLSNSVYTDQGSKKTLCRVYTKVMYFKNNNGADDRVSLKELQYVELWASDIYHDVDVKVYYRPEGYPLWSTLGTATIQAAGSAYPQRRRKLRIALSDDAKTYDPETKGALFKASGFQFCIEWSGNLKLTTARFVANGPLAETPNLACAEEDLSDTLTASSDLFELDDYTYNIEG